MERFHGHTENFQSGNFEKTDNPLDLAIDGDGFFMVLGPRET